MFIRTALLVLTMVSSSAVAGDQSPFKTVILPYGISLDVPTSWIGFSPQAKAQLEAATQAAVDLSGFNFDVHELRQLLDIQQPLSGSYARLILSVGVGERATQQEVRSLSRDDLRELEAEYRTTIEKMAKPMALRIIEWYPLDRKDINGKTYLIVRFVRSSPTPGESTYKEAYRLEDSDKSINFSIEYRQRDKVLWDPICRKSLASLNVASSN